MQLKRVVVTGLGALTPIGNNIQEYWEGLINGKSGAAPITYYDTEKHKTKFACEVKNFNVEDFIDRKEARRMDKFAQYAVVASDEAIKDAGITSDNVDKHRVGVIWGAGIGGLETFQEEVLYYAKGDGTPKFNPFFIPKMIADIAPAHISMRNGFMGPNYTTVSACASSANALIDAFNYIRLGMCDVIISGGSEAAVTIAGMGGFNSMHALSTRNESPETASRPFDATRDGFVLGEGAGALVLEEYEHAKARGAKIYCEVGGGGMSSDAYHLTAPHPEGLGAKNVMKLAIESEHPLRSVTTTEYAPLINESKSSSVSVFDQAKVYVGTPPMTVKSIKPSSPPKQETALESVLNSSKVGCTKVTEALTSQALVSVINTL